MYHFDGGHPWKPDGAVIIIFVTLIVLFSLGFYFSKNSKPHPKPKFNSHCNCCHHETIHT